MAFLFYIFTLFLSCQQIQTCETNLWQQIIPLIKKTEVNKTPNVQDTLKDCVAQAIILDGDSPKALEGETLQTLQSLHLFSDILPKIAFNNLHWGYFELARNSCQITDDIATLKKRNIFSLYLQSNPDIMTEFSEVLKKLKNAEADFLLHFYLKSIRKEEHTPSGAIEEGFSYLEELEKKILSNRYAGGIYKLIKQTKTGLSICASFVTLYHFKEFHEHNNSELSWGFKQMFVPDNYADKIASSWPVSIPWTTLMTVGTLVGITLTTKSLKADFDQAAQKQKSLLLFKEVIKASKKIVKIIDKNPTLEQ